MAWHLPSGFGSLTAYRRHRANDLPDRNNEEQLPCHCLYRGERLSFEFQRTTSRLIEMQSEDYLAREHRP